jgi:hypothetical protein
MKPKQLRKNYTKPSETPENCDHVLLLNPFCRSILSTH